VREVQLGSGERVGNRGRAESLVCKERQEKTEEVNKERKVVVVEMVNQAVQTSVQDARENEVSRVCPDEVQLGIPVPPEEQEGKENEEDQETVGSSECPERKDNKENGDHGACNKGTSNSPVSHKEDSTETKVSLEILVSKEREESLDQFSETNQDHLVTEVTEDHLGQEVLQGSMDVKEQEDL